MKKKLYAFVFCVLLLFGALWFSTAQVPSIRPCSPITCPLVIFRGDVTVEGTFTASGTTTAGEILLTDGTDTHSIKAVQETGLGGRLTLGLDETARTLIVCDYGDIDVDFGIAASSEPLLAVMDATGTYRSHMTYFGVYFNDTAFGITSLNRTNDPLSFNAILDHPIDHMFAFTSSANREITDTDAEQAWMYIEPKVNQTATAGYVGLLMDVTETSTGSGTNELLALRVATVDKFTISNTGLITAFGGIQNSGAALLIQDDAAQNINLFASAGAGENPYLYIYGDVSGTAKYGKIGVGSSGQFSINAEVYGSIERTGNVVATWGTDNFKMQDNIDFVFGGSSDYLMKFNATSNLIEAVDGGTCTGASMEYGSWVVKKTVNHDDTSPVACATVADGYVVLATYVEIVEIWDGNGTIEIGDGTDPNGFLPDAAITQGTQGYYGRIHQNRGAYLWDGTGDDEEAYTGADTVDATLVVGTSTQGQAIVYTVIRRLK